MRGPVRGVTSALAIVAATLSSGCGFLFTEFKFEREAEAAAGEIKGQAVRADLDDRPPAAFATVLAKGAGAIRRAGSDGSFTFKGLAPGPWVFQVQDDADGDGWPERTSTVTAVVRVGPKPSGLFGDGPTEASAVLLGRVPVDGTTEVKGRVLVETASGRRTPRELGTIARVLVTRDFDLPTGIDEAFNTVSLGAEAQTAADASGAFVFSNVGSGTFQVVAFLFEDTGNPLQPGRLLGATQPVFLRGFAGDALDLSDTPLVAPPIGPQPVSGTRAVQIAVSPEPEGSVYAIYVPQGRAPPPCEVSPPADYSATPFPYAARTDFTPGGSDVLLQLPFGVFDVELCTDQGQDGPQGTLFEATIPVPEGDPQAALPVVMGPVLLTAADACGAPDKPDCDGDGLTGLPPFSPTTQGLWASCVSSCGQAFGEENGASGCTVGAETFDCDDDGDGQPDVTEDPACYGLGRGTDLDGDGLCSGQDPFPQCTANNADDCVAGEYDFAPQVPPDYQGAGESVFDGSFNGQGWASFNGPEGGADEARAVLRDGNGRLLIVGATADPQGSSAAVWRLNEADGSLDSTWGTGGLLRVNELGADALLASTHAYAAALEPELGGVFLVGSYQEFESLADLLIVKLDADGQPAAGFGANGIVTFDAAIAAATGAATNETGFAAVIDGNTLYVAGRGQNPLSPTSIDAFVCAFDATTGALDVNAFGGLDMGGCVFIDEPADGPPTDESATGLAILPTGEIGVAGEQLVGDPANGQQRFGWYWTLPLGAESDVVQRLRLSSIPGSSAAGLVADDLGRGAYVAGTDVDDGGAPLLALWRVFDGTAVPVLRERGSGSDAFGFGLALDPGGRIYTVGGKKQGVEGDLDLLVYRYDPQAGNAQLIVEHGDAAGGSGDDVGYSALVDDNGKLVVAGASLGAQDPDVAVWRLVPSGASGGGTSVPPDGGAPDAGTGGEIRTCLTHSECNDVVGCSAPLVPMCLPGSNTCSCADACSDPFAFVNVPIPITVTSEADLETLAGVDCIVGDVTVSSYQDLRFSDALPSLRVMRGAVTIHNPQQSSALEVINLPELYAVEGVLVIDGNFEPVSGTGLRQIFVPSLRRVTAGLSVSNNYALPTADVVSILNNLEVPPEPGAITITGNGCSVDLADCYALDTCETDAATGLDICVAPPMP